MPIGDLLASITGEPSPTQATAPPLPLPIKRKASDGDPLRRPVDKLQRTGSGTPSSNTFGSLTTQSTRPSAVDTPMSKMRLSSGSNGKPSVLSPAASSPFKNGRPTPPLNDAPAKVAMPVKPPKKGSYAEIMARGKVAQATMGQVGKIQHKPIQKLPSKKEREEMAAQKSAKMQKNIGPGGKFRNTPDAQAIKGKGETSQGMVKGKRKEAPPEPEKKVKKAATATTGYAGTARPKPGAGKVASRPGQTTSSRYGRESDRHRDDRYSTSKRYTYASEEEDEDEEEEGYGSDASSDMEAAAFEVDEEEELATRIARKEDAEALAEENRLKREKAEKKRRLEALARRRR
ncbi:hypothetical protein BGZ60DRAFT_404334 [Tricladium varicosporioides]|nr:hypothetical protein BGZ60DRAFT_404334 [Hymenoscyphus varicosporioides]